MNNTIILDIIYQGLDKFLDIYSRECFASGAIKAIKFVARVQEPKIYSTVEVLGIQ